MKVKDLKKLLDRVEDSNKELFFYDPILGFLMVEGVYLKPITISKKNFYGAMIFVEGKTGLEEKDVMYLSLTK